MLNWIKTHGSVTKPEVGIIYQKVMLRVHTVFFLVEHPSVFFRKSQTVAQFQNGSL